jgi:hypothetical protein
MSQKTLDDFESTGVECPECGDHFDGERGLSSHYGQIHGGSWKTVEVDCDYCGKTLEKRPSLVNDKNYCGMDCLSKGKEGKKPHNKNREIRNCGYCSGEFEVTVNSEAKFCSRECYHSNNKETGALKGENNPIYKEPVEITCEWCGGTDMVPPVHSDRRFCEAECKHEWMASRTGPDHPLFEGGRDYYVAIRRALGPTGWESLRQEYNKNECKMCGAETSPRGRDLSLHHIVPVLSGGTNGGYNFMTLCEPCHSKAETYCSDLPGFERYLTG